MLLWFVAIAAMGIAGIVRHPSVFAALNPAYGLSYLFSHGATGFLVLGAVFLCVTGAEALYADMGHFGRRPIKLAWFAIVFPSLILKLCRAGSAGAGRRSHRRQYFSSGCVPDVLLLPLIVLADGGNHHCQSIDHYGGFLDDTAGDPAWLVTKVADQAHLIGGLRTDLRWRSSTGC